MQKVLGLAIVALVALAALQFQTVPTLQLSNSSDAYQQYVAWKARYGKNTNGSEDQLRFSVFLENKQYVELTNEQEGKEVVGLNGFADLTNSEFQELYTNEYTPLESTATESTESAAFDKDINWATAGVVTSIKDQGNCGGCWAFAANAAMESLNAINGGSLESFSNQQLVSCVKKVNGCRGGNAIYAFYYAKSTGLTTESAYPYENGNQSTTLPCEFSNQPVVYHTGGKFDGGQQLSRRNSSVIYNNLVNQPVTVGIRAGSLAFQLNKGSVIEKSCGGALNHQVTVIGYSVSEDAYIIKNSWGTTWGNSGFGKVSASQKTGAGVCGINSDPQIPNQ